jgi:hypothetical protein
MTHLAAGRRRQLRYLLVACVMIICDGAMNEGGLPAPASAEVSSPAHGNAAVPSRPPVLSRAPIVRVLRDDRVATLEMDYNASKPSGQFWNMSGSPDDDAGFLVIWGPQATAQLERTRLAELPSEGLCLSPASKLSRAAAPALAPVSATPLSLTDLPVGARWIVTGNRRVQLQPLENDRTYVVRVQRLSARGKISSRATEISFNGGDGARVAALRTSLTYFDDFSLPQGAPDEKLWNNASSVNTDPRFNLFFINDQFHAHSVNGTRYVNSDKSQTSQRFRKKIRLEPETRRRIVFDMDAPLSPRSVWYLDLNPIPTELTGHTGFFDEERSLGLPAGVLRLRSTGQTFSVHIIDLQGASHQVASVNVEQFGRQVVPNVRRSFDVRVGTTGIQVFIDSASVINANYGAYTLPPADYDLLWVAFGYHTDKDGVSYFLQHWDNFGFDGPVVDARTVHNYVTRIEGTDYRAARRGEPATFTVNIPDDLHPVTTGATAEAWLVATYETKGSSPLKVAPGNFVQVNGGARYPLPQPLNNSTPLNASADNLHTPHTTRIKLGDIVKGGSSPLAVGSNSFRFEVETAGITNVHVEVFYPPGSAPAYTPPSALHHVPLHTELPRLGPPVRLQRIASVDVGRDQQITNPNRVPIPVRGRVPINIEAGNSSWANWAPQHMNVPVQSIEVWSTGGSTGLAKIEAFLRRADGGSGPSERILQIDTAVDAPAPQGRYLLDFDSRAFANGDYELFVQATTPSGQKSHPSYGDETYRFDATELSGAYYPIPIRIQN